MTALAIAAVCHEANRAYCAEIGDDSQLPWAEAPDWQRESALAGVEAILADPSRTPEQSHVAWCAHKAADGWIYGPVKDPARKEHPCMVPYGALPPEQQRKDHLFRAIVLALSGV